MRTRNLFSLSLVCLVSSSFLSAANKPTKVNGSKPSSKSASFLINNEFCEATTPYEYTTPGNLKPNQPSIAWANIDPNKTPVTAPISNLQTFDDPGTSIITSESHALLSDGSDASRLLVRSFSAGTCPQSGPLVRFNPASSSKTGFSLLDVNYYIINLVVWSKDDSQKTLSTTSNDWFLFNTKDKTIARQTPFEYFHPNVSPNTRVYGSKTVGFLAVHLWETSSINLVISRSLSEKSGDRNHFGGATKQDVPIMFYGQELPTVLSG